MMRSSVSFIIGLLLITLSFTPWFIHVPVTLINSMGFCFLWAAGYLLICNEIISKYSRKRGIPHYHLSNLHVFLVGLVGAFLIEAVGNWYLKLWYYPLFSLYLYIFILPFILMGYFYVLVRGFVAVQLLLFDYIKPRAEVGLPTKKLAFVFHLLGVLGTLGIITSLFRTFIHFHFTNIALFLNSSGVKTFSLFDILLLTVSLFFVIEFLEYELREDTFLMHLCTGDWLPLLTILAVSLVTSLTMEIFNVPLLLWIYTNWPYSDIALLGVPVSVLLAWPVQYLLLVSFYRVMYKKETVKIWA